VIILFFLAAIFSELIGTIAGFGSSTIFLPLSLFFFDFRTALVLVALFHVMGNVIRLSLFRKGVHLRTILIFGLPSIVFTLFGAMLVSRVDQDALKGYLGIFLIAFTLLMAWKHNFSIKNTSPNLVFGGALSGFLAGLIGTGGALRGAFLTGVKLPKSRYLATTAAIAVAVDLTRIPIYLRDGFLQRANYWIVPVLLVCSVIGAYLGTWIVRRFTYALFRTVVLVTILLAGVYFVVQWVR